MGKYQLKRPEDSEVEYDPSRFEEFEFVDPVLETDGDLSLRLVETRPYDPKTGFVPEYKFVMVHTESGAEMGAIDLRAGLSQKLAIFGGHLGYSVKETYRGRRYAARSCRLLFPLLRQLGINPVLITCDPGNRASARTIESLGADLVATYGVELKPGLVRPTSLYHLWL